MSLQSSSDSLSSPTDFNSSSSISQHLIPKYILSNDLPTRKIVTRKERLQRLSQNQLPNEEISCRNCGSFETIASPADGDYICAECGCVYESPIYAELTPFYWSSRSTSNIDNFDHLCKQGSIGNGTTYVRHFHFNEILAAIFLTGPWIPNSDMRLIREELKDSNLSNPGKSDIQLACKKINKKFGVRRFSQKYSEKWIQIIFRYCGDRPGELNPDTMDSLRQGFRLLSSCWDDASTMLVGSKDPNKRIQWPNYFETLYRIIRYKHPEILDKLKRWIPRLSKKKRKDLKPFFQRLFYLVGWPKK